MLIAPTPVQKRAKAGLVEDLQMQVLREQLKFYKTQNEKVEDDNMQQYCVKELLGRIETLEDSSFSQGLINAINTIKTYKELDNRNNKVFISWQRSYTARQRGMLLC